MTNILFIILSLSMPINSGDLLFYSPENEGIAQLWHQPEGNIEVYSHNEDALYVQLRMMHSYKKEDDIFIFPCEFQEISELYCLGFYVDMDTKIKNAMDAYNYRILYRGCPAKCSIVQKHMIPEPVSLLLFFLICFILIRKK